MGSDQVTCWHPAAAAVKIDSRLKPQAPAAAVTLPRMTSSQRDHGTPRRKQRAWRTVPAMPAHEGSPDARQAPPESRWHTLCRPGSGAVLMLNGMHLTLLSGDAATAVSLAAFGIVLVVCSTILILGKAALQDAPAQHRPSILRELATVALALLRLGTGRRLRRPPPERRRISPRRRR